MCAPSCEFWRSLANSDELWRTHNTIFMRTSLTFTRVLAEVPHIHQSSGEGATAFRICPNDGHHSEATSSQGMKTRELLILGDGGPMRTGILCHWTAESSRAPRPLYPQRVVGDRQGIERVSGGYSPPGRASALRPPRLPSPAPAPPPAPPPSPLPPLCPK